MQGLFKARTRGFVNKALLFSASVSALAIAAAVYSLPAMAQTSANSAANPAPEDIETVTVTGTSFRGVQPVGSNLISYGQVEIQKTNVQTLQNIWRDIPAISNNGQVPQGNSVNNSYSAPTIHNLGSSSSNSTLVLIDGHRFSPSTFQQALMDPGIIPINMVERVEVLTDGASATYGADASAGVINVVTRKNYEGLQIAGQTGVANGGYNTLNGSVLFGTRWANSSLIMAASYSFAGTLKTSNRYPTADFRPQGGTNNNTFFCDPAVIQPTGSSAYYLSAASASTYPTAQSGALCNANAYNSITQQEMRVNAMVRYQQDITDTLHFDVDFIAGHRMDKSPASRGTLQSVGFATGSQANPFYTNPPGVTATSQTLRWDANALLGPGAWRDDDSLSMNAHMALDWDISDDWHAGFNTVFGTDYTRQNSYGTLCGACANLALNGTTNGSGNTTTVSIPGTTAIAVQSLTTANALDLWNPAATNRTSPAVLRSLTDNNQENPFYYNIQQYKAQVDGKVLALPGGDVHIALGAEYQHWGQQANYIIQDGIGGSSIGSGLLTFPLKRDVTAAYFELLVPVIGREMSIPLVNSFTIDVAGRYDHYSDFGDTTNPKIGFDWELVEGFKVRGNAATSFTAPQLIQVGDPTRNGQGNSTVAPSNAAFTVSTAAFPSAIGLPGCSAAQAAAGGNSCNIGSTVTGVNQGGNANPGPAFGRTWSLGFDLTPAIIPGLSVHANLFNNRLINMLSSTNMAQALGAPSQNLITFFPNGMTQAQLNAAQPPFFRATGVFPAPSQVYYVLNTAVKNFLFLTIEGVDLSADYNYQTDNWGDFNVGTNLTQFTMFKQHFKGNPNVFSVLGTDGFNGTIASVPTQARFHLGWNINGFDTTLYMNYLSGYKNWGASTVSPVNLVNGVPNNGGDQVKANVTFDMHVNYTFNDMGVFGQSLNGDEVYFDMANIFDKAPVFYNGSNGYDQFTGNPIGRLITVGFRARF